MSCSFVNDLLSIKPLVTGVIHYLYRRKVLTKKKWIVKIIIRWKYLKIFR